MPLGNKQIAGQKERMRLALILSKSDGSTPLGGGIIDPPFIIIKELTVPPINNPSTTTRIFLRVGFIAELDLGVTVYKFVPNRDL